MALALVDQHFAASVGFPQRAGRGFTRLSSCGSARPPVWLRRVHFPSSITPLHSPGLAGPVVYVHVELGGLVGVCAGALSPRAGRVLLTLDL